MSDHLTLAARWDQIADAQPDRVALTTPDQTNSAPTNSDPTNPDAAVTFGQLRRRSLCVAAGLQEAGAGVGDRVAVIGPDSTAFFELLYACSRIGAIIVPVNWRLTSVEIDYILGDCQPQITFADPVRPGLEGSATQALDPTTFARWRESFEPCDSVPEVDPDRPVAVMYTSGTTGHPKGVVLAERTFFAVAGLLADGELDWIDWRRDDVSLAALPSFHIGGLWWATQSLNAAVPTVLMGHFTPSTAVELIIRHAVTITCLVPSMMLLLLSELAARDQRLTSLRKTVYGGSPISPHLLRQYLHTMRCELVQIYGLTETGNTAVCLPPSDHDGDNPRLLAAGKPYPGIDLRIVDPQGHRTPVGDNGEVLIRSPARMLGYWNLPTETAATLVDEWVRTGDIGFIDDQGYLYIRDRLKDMIIVAGENVYPAEVEKVLQAHPDVLDAAVIGAPDDQWGERVHAYVVLAPEPMTKPLDLARYASARLARYKCPRHYEFVDAVPRNSSGKILRRVLRETFWHDRDRQVN